MSRVDLIGLHGKAPESFSGVLEELTTMVPRGLALVVLFRRSSRAPHRAPHARLPSSKARALSLRSTRAKAARSQPTCQAPAEREATSSDLREATAA